MENVSKRFQGRTSKRRVVMLPEGNYCIDVVDLMFTNSKQALKVDDEKWCIIVDDLAEPKQSSFKEETEQLAVLGVITTGRYKGRKTMYRFPLVGYSKPDGKTDEQMIKKGYQQLSEEGSSVSYWVDKAGNRMESTEATEQALGNVDDFMCAVMDKIECTWDEFEEHFENSDEPTHLNIKITASQYNGRTQNHWNGFFRYDESYGVEESETADETVASETSY